VVARPLLAWLALALVLAGCASPKPAPAALAGDDPAAAAPALHATATTGVIRGVVVDQAIRPLPNATATLVAGSVRRTATSDARGFFGFEGLAAGGYTVDVGKAGYPTVQQAVQVVAGVAEPPIAKFLLQALPGTLPFYTQVRWEGYLECSFVSSNTCAAVNILFPNATNDRGLIQMKGLWTGENRPPDWMQAETTWQPSATAFSSISMMHTAASADEWAAGDDYHIGRYWQHGGPPLTNQWNRTFAEANWLGTLRDPVFLATNGPFSFIPDPPVPKDDRVGVAMEQPFELFLTTFYGYAPPADWRFLASGDVPAPPQ